MAKTNAARNARNMRTFEYMQRKLIAAIDKRAKENAVEADVANKHYVGTTSEGERCWSF
jgi:molybdopterin synthase catalytic subunit